jgi:general secretion pathway protein H
MRWLRESSGAARGRRARAEGFSLFELIIVMLIVAIAGALVGPAVQSGWRSREIRQGTRKLAGVMRGLRERAVRRGVDQELVLEPDGETIRWSGGEVATLPDGVVISGIRGGWRDPDGRVRAAFYPSGGTSGLGVVVAGRGEGGLQFTVELDPLLGSVVIREVSE